LCLSVRVWAWVAVGGWIGSGWIDIDTGNMQHAIGNRQQATGNRQQATSNEAVFALHTVVYISHNPLASRSVDRC
jgi:hypothetical protein